MPSAPPFALTLDFVDLHQAVARIFDLIRRMGFGLDHCAIEPNNHGYRMNLRLTDATDDPARQATLVYRLGQVPAVDAVDTGVEAGVAPRPRPGVSMVLGTEFPPA